MAVKIQGGDSAAGIANVDDNFNSQVNLPYGSQGGGIGAAGFAGMAAEMDNGSVTGTRRILAAEINSTYRLRAGLESPIFSIAFEGTIIARDRIQQNDTSATSAQSLGYLVLNSGGSITSGQGTNIRTYRTFTLSQNFPLYANFTAKFNNPTATNAVTEVGLGYCSGVTAQLTDGVFFRMISSGTLLAVITTSASGSGVDTFSQAITTTNIPPKNGTGSFTITDPNDYIIEVSNGYVAWWINDALVAYTKAPANSPAPYLASSQPFFARTYNSGTASLARSLSLGYLSVTQGDMASNKSYGQIMCGQGGGSYQNQPGVTSGPTVTRAATATAGWPNSAQARGAGTWTATSAPAVNSLGGQWVSPAISTLTSEADYPIFSYQNPAGTATLPGKTLYITGVKWGKTVATAAATNNINFNFILGVGGTSSATTQTEAASVVAARGIVLDTIPFKSTTVVGDYVEGGDNDFSQAPLIVYPGCFITFIVRPFGAVAANTLTVVGNVSFDGYFE